MQACNLSFDGQLVGTAKVADTFGYDQDHCDHSFLFKDDGGHDLLVDRAIAPSGGREL